MAKYTNFRIIYLNFNVIYLILSLYVFYKCTFEKGYREDQKKLFALGIIATVEGIMTSYFGFLAIGFRSKVWAQIQMVFGIVLIPFLVLALVFEKMRRMDGFSDESCTYLMIAMFALNISIIFLANRYIRCLRKELDSTQASDSSQLPLNSTPRNSMPHNIFITGSLPSITETSWGWAPFGRTCQQIGSLSTIASTPNVNLLIDPKQLQITGNMTKLTEKDSITETRV